MQVCWNTHDILDRIADLPVDGPLPRRTIVVPKARVAHRVRCGLIQGNRCDLLAGTSFVTVKTLATEVLQAAKVLPREGENELRLSRLHVLFKKEGLNPEYFGRELVMSAPGWEEALARTIGDLERAGLSAADLDGISTPVGRGLAQVWRKLDEKAEVSARRTGPATRAASVTRAGLVARAAAALERAPNLARDWGSVLAVVSGYADGVEARLIRAIPGVELVLRAVRPVREELTKRVEVLFGPEARVALEEAVPDRSGRTDLEVLRGHLFEPPEVQSAATRSRAGVNPDGTAVLEEHAGVAAEIEATADWVAQQVLAHRTPLEEIAVLVPRLDPLAQLVSDRLRRLPWEGEFPVYVAGSCPLTSSSSGGRMVTVMEALRGHLSVEGVARVLPLLRASGETRTIARGAAIDLAQSLGTVGGSVAHTRGALEWTERLDRREKALAGWVEEAAKVEGAEEQAGLVRDLREMEAQLEVLQVVRPGLEQLVGVAAAVIENRPLFEVWPLLKGFLETWVLHDEDEQVLEDLAKSVDPTCQDTMCSTLAGGDALGLIEASLLGLRVPVGRFGDPAVYVGTVSGAVGLSFAAVRVMGLVDGTIPAAPQEDTVLPDDLRNKVGEGRVTTAADAALRSLHELYQLVQDTGRELVLSTPRLGLSRSYREPSSVFLEVATALGRTAADDSGDDARVPGVPDLEAIRRREFGLARQRAAIYRRDHPIGEAAWQDRVAEDRRKQRAPMVPDDWLAGGVLNLGRMASLHPAVGSAVMEGILGEDAEGPAIPGMQRYPALSASRWRTFLSCPHHFLYEHLLGWREPTEARAQRELDALAYGSLFHKVLDRFFKASGKEFWKKEDVLAGWQENVRKVAEKEFEELLEQYPLAGEAVRQQQLDRLRGEVVEFVAFLWEQGPCRFVASEQSFGYDRPVELATGEAPLFVRGLVDLVCVRGKATRIWDVKTGKCRPRLGNEAGPTPTVDAQIALYGLVTAKLAGTWGATTQRQAAYAHSNERAGRLRNFAEDYADLEAAGRSWLEVTAGLMAQHSFPRSTSSDDCTFCPFVPVCGPRATERSAAGRADVDGMLKAFAEVRS